MGTIVIFKFIDLSLYLHQAPLFILGLKLNTHIHPSLSVVRFCNCDAQYVPFHCFVLSCTSIQNAPVLVARPIKNSKIELFKYSTQLHPIDSYLDCKDNAYMVCLGRYNKLARGLAQTPWIIDGQRRGETSVQVSYIVFFLSFICDCFMSS